MKIDWKSAEAEAWCRNFQYDDYLKLCAITGKTEVLSKEDLKHEYQRLDMYHEAEMLS